jgi:hypothetical protein
MLIIAVLTVNDVVNYSTKRNITLNYRNELFSKHDSQEARTLEKKYIYSTSIKTKT